MPVEVVMPRFSDTMEEGKILKWFKHEGDQVEKGQPLLEVETDKANMEMESYESGVLQKIMIKEGETAPVGAPIAIIESGAQSKAAPAAPAKSEAVRAPAPPRRAETPAPARAAAAVSAPEQTAAVKESRVKASPLAKRMADDRGIDLEAIEGTGPGGRVTEKDVETFVSQLKPRRTPSARPAPSPMEAAPRPAGKAPAMAAAEEVEMVPLTKMQQTIANRMSEINSTVPHFHVTSEIDMTEAVKVRKFLNETGGDVKISLNDLIVKGVALALERFPNVNSFYRDGEFERHPWINIGIAVSVENGLLVPVVRDVDKKDLRAIAMDTAQLIERTREERLLPNDLEGGTFTVTNLGMFGVEEFNAIINAPQSGILAVGAVKRKPVVVDDELEVRDLMNVTLSCDHRIVYGAEAARFLQELKRLLENPLNLVV